MAKKKELPDITTEEFGQLIRDITKRMIIVGLILIAVGALIILLMYLIYGGK